MFKVELHDREKRLLNAQESELQESVQSLQRELGMSQTFSNNVCFMFVPMSVLTYDMSRYSTS